MPETEGSEHSEPKRAMDYSAVPEELRNACIWLPFRTRPRRSGDPADVHKVPYDADGRGADYPNPEVWMPFDKALEMFSTDAYEGIGICTTESMGYVLVDFDDCVEDGVIAPDVIELIRQLDTYTEWSYSGTGVHLIAKGKWFSGHKASTQTGTIEVYDSKRFFVVTGEILEGSRSTIEPRQDVIDYVDRSYDFSARTNRRSGATQRSKAPVEVTVKCDKPPLFTDEAVIRAIDQLWLLNRYWNGWRGPDEDASSADFALGCGLAFLTDHNVNQMRRLMMQSKLNRPKYQTRRGHSDYLGYTLEKCIGRVSGSWDGSYDSLPPSSVNYGSELIADRKDPCAAGATSCANNRLNSGACPKDTLNRPNDCEVEPEPY